MLDRVNLLSMIRFCKLLPPLPRPMAMLVSAQACAIHASASGASRVLAFQNSCRVSVTNLGSRSVRVNFGRPQLFCNRRARRRRA